MANIWLPLGFLQTNIWLGMQRSASLTLSCLGPRLDRVLSLAIHISPTNGPIDMVSVAKLIYYVLPIHFACQSFKSDYCLPSYSRCTGYVIGTVVS